MSKNNIYSIIALSIILIILIALPVYLHLLLEHNRNQDHLLKEKVNKYQQQLKLDRKNLTLLEKQVTNIKNDLEYYSNIPNNILYEDYKKRIAELIKKDISKIVSEEPLLGGKWFATKIIFIDPLLVSVEYEDGHFSFESKIKIIRPKEKIIFEVVNRP
jgi:hypothetical protein